ncbi:MAG: hypothetical protein LJE68_14275 [Rhodobacter sp.]|nr:hypothetical protein [Rhodobacter sp.]
MNEDRTPDEVPATGHSSKPVSQDDKRSFSELVKLAEEISLNISNLQRRQIFATIALMAAFAAVIGAAVYIFASGPEKSLIDSSGVIIFAVIIAGAISVYLPTALFQGRITKEEKALQETVTLVHEVFESMQASLSPLELAQNKIRLARLGI